MKDSSSAVYENMRRGATSGVNAELHHKQRLKPRYIKEVISRKRIVLPKHISKKNSEAPSKTFIH